MSHYAKIEDGIVSAVIVIDDDLVNTLDGLWIKTSYNTINGKHTLGGTPLRENYAAIGGIYDEVLDAFIPPSPYASWRRDGLVWLPPVAKPDTVGIWEWDEASQKWVSFTPSTPDTINTAPDQG